ncbi:hypothetical protein VTO42DRAFT_2677 [Malbranchea cinnamomea]
MVSPLYSELGRSLGILDDELPWYWTLPVHGSPWLLMAGFVMFPLAMDRSDISANKSAITVTSSIILGVSYVVCATSCLRWRKSHILQDLLLIPFFWSSLIGLLNVALNISVRRLYPLDTLSIAVVSIGSVSTVGFGSAALYNSQIEKYVPKILKNRRRFVDSGVDDEELQRRQLLRLYLKKDRDCAPSTEVSQNTFRIDLPDVDGYDAEEQMVVSQPHHTYEQQQQQQQHLPPAAPPTNYSPFVMHESSPSLTHTPSQSSGSNNLVQYRNSGGSYGKPTALRSWYNQRLGRDPRRPLAELGDL